MFVSFEFMLSHWLLKIPCFFVQIFRIVGIIVRLSIVRSCLCIHVCRIIVSKITIGIIPRLAIIGSRLRVHICRVIISEITIGIIPRWIISRSRLFIDVCGIVIGESTTSIIPGLTTKFFNIHLVRTTRGP